MVREAKAIAVYFFSAFQIFFTKVNRQTTPNFSGRCATLGTENRERHFSEQATVEIACHGQKRVNALEETSNETRSKA